MHPLFELSPDNETKHIAHRMTAGPFALRNVAKHDVAFVRFQHFR
jgi:hypothetical protein